ncbi:VTNC protein, partial [Amia calva]|nr:VTNC protein [Amia calva]
MKLAVILLLTGLGIALAAEDSCDGRCDNGFESSKKCQCDSMCKYYKSCCIDYDSVCKVKARGDVFNFPEDDYDYYSNNDTATSTGPPVSGATLRPNSFKPGHTDTQDIHPTLSTSQSPAPPTIAGPAAPSNSSGPLPEAEACSGKSFDAFMQLKNGSIFAFRGENFYELDEKAVKPGYPKLIKDVWGIEGPIDAAFTRINCQGKTYIFKGNQYWRFDDTVMDPDYPRDISVGFTKIPGHVDAAFALPAPGYYGKEKVYFFKGDQYYQYEFRHQPSQEECNKIAGSTQFIRYTALYKDSFEDLFSFLFQSMHSGSTGPRSIRRDWVGIQGPVDAVMAGRLYVSPKTPAAVSREQGNRRRNGNRRRAGRNKGRRQSRSLSWDILDLGLDLGLGLDYNPDRDHKPGQNRYNGNRQQQQQQQQQQQGDYYDYNYGLNLPGIDSTSKCQVPIQNIYFFIQDKYYRVNLQTKRVDSAHPPYPRSIAKYWLGCPEKDLAEKK